MRQNHVAAVAAGGAEAVVDFRNRKSADFDRKCCSGLDSFRFRSLSHFRLPKLPWGMRILFLGFVVDRSVGIGFYPDPTNDPHYLGHYFLHFRFLWLGIDFGCFELFKLKQDIIYMCISQSNQYYSCKSDIILL